MIDLAAYPIQACVGLADMDEVQDGLFELRQNGQRARFLSKMEDMTVKAITVQERERLRDAQRQRENGNYCRTHSDHVHVRFIDELYSI